jgi:hypothetical protein
MIFNMPSFMNPPTFGSAGRTGEGFLRTFTTTGMTNTPTGVRGT